MDEDARKRGVILIQFESAVQTVLVPGYFAKQAGRAAQL